MILDLQLFGGGGGSSGGGGGDRLSSGRGSKASAEAYDKEREYWWDVPAKSGVGNLADWLEHNNGGKPLGDKKVSAKVGANTPLGKKLSGLIGKNTGTDNITISRADDGSIVVNTNRAGFSELSKWLRKQMKSGRWW